MAQSLPHLPSPVGLVRRSRRAVLGGLTCAVVCVVLAGAPVGAAGTDPVGVWPLSPEPQVVGHFEPPPTTYGAGHRGVDLLGGAGEPVRAALAGRVTFAGSLAGRGVVVVDHGATRTTYEPVAASVAVGATVAAGGRLGVLQTGGSHCAPRPCLHWGWIEDPQTYLDPLRLVGAGPVRLLPLWRADPVATSPGSRAGARSFLLPDVLPWYAVPGLPWAGW